MKKYQAREIENQESENRRRRNENCKSAAKTCGGENRKPRKKMAKSITAQKMKAKMKSINEEIEKSIGVIWKYGNDGVGENRWRNRNETAIEEKRSWWRMAYRENNEISEESETAKTGMAKSRKRRRWKICGGGGVMAATERKTKMKKKWKKAARNKENEENCGGEREEK